MGRLTTHVLDTAQGRPAAGLRLALFYLDGPSGEPLVDAVTNADGRLDAPLLEGDAFRPGAYQIHFHVGDYFGALGRPDAGARFLDVVKIPFGVADAREHYHVPLLVSPFGYTTYRGS